MNEGQCKMTINFYCLNHYMLLFAPIYTQRLVLVKVSGCWPISLFWHPASSYSFKYGTCPSVHVKSSQAIALISNKGIGIGLIKCIHVWGK